MDGAPIQNARKACEMIASSIGPNDWLSIVTFCHQAELLFPLSQVKDLNRLLLAIQKIYLGMGTNLLEGWLLGKEELKKAPSGVERRMLLLTDGLISSGVSNRDQISALIEAGQKTDQIRTSAVGFGLNYDEDLLSRIAKVCGGNFHDADSAKKLPLIFREEFNGLKSVSSKNVGIEVSVHPCCHAVESLSDYPVTLENKVIHFTLGDMGSEETRVLALRLNLGPLAVSKSDISVCDIYIHWESVDSSPGPTDYREQVCLKITDDPVGVSLNTAPLRWISVQLAGKAINKSIASAQHGRIEEAKDILKGAIETLRAYSHNALTHDGLSVLEEFLKAIEFEQGYSALVAKQAKYTAAFFSRPSNKQAFTTGIISKPSFTRQLPLS